MEIRCYSEGCYHQANGQCQVLTLGIDEKQKCMSYEPQSILKPKKNLKKKGR